VFPKYANLKFTNNSPASQVTTKKAQTLHVKNEIKFLFKKKDKLNQDLCTLHLRAAQEWGSMWPKIQNSIHESLNYEMEQKYKTLDMKIRKLVHTQTQKPSTNTKFYPKVINKTSISFTDEELTLLNKGLNHKRKY